MHRFKNTSLTFWISLAPLLIAFHYGGLLGVIVLRFITR